MPMTPEKEDALVDKMAAEICYAGFSGIYDYGGTGRYWEGVSPEKKAAYRKEARAALSIAAPILRNEAICDHLETVDELPAKFEEWLVENRDVLGISIVTSLLYDINLLPEQVATFKSMKMLRYCVAVVEHFKMARNEALEEAASVADGAITLYGHRGVELVQTWSREEIASAIRSLKTKDKPE
jgi:hypothetical protein